ncbi:MAG: Asp23/Gls24 family envelope stress response protein, partial [Oscillospiraceae bacterium]|nr:Asp23/Gls24 family envelope stress response protein [Oscillospiraceae bacterium]
MEREKHETIGNLKISQDVVATVANFSAKEIDGVASMASCPATVNLKKFLGRNQQVKATNKSINIEMNDDVAIIDVYVNLKYGAKIPVVSENIQKSMKNAVQSMTGIVVAKVNVFVVGISFDEAAAQ